jgi:hypothetical protein
VFGAIEAGHDRRNRDLNRTGAAHVTIPLMNAGSRAPRTPPRSAERGHGVQRLPGPHRSVLLI